MTSTPTPMTERYHGLDLLRGFAMMLGLLMHASLGYTMPELAEYLGVEPVDPNDVADWIYLLTAWIHQWRMPVFFVLAGFFGAMMLYRRGPSAFFKDRLLRIGLALLVFAALFDLMYMPIDLELGHLWFLYYLMGIIALASGAAWLMARVDGAAKLARGLAWPAQRLWRWPLYLLPIIALTPFARSQGWAVIPLYFGDFDLLPFLYYGLWFGIGAALFEHRSVLSAFKSWTMLAVSLTIATVTMFAGFDVLIEGEDYQGAWYEWAIFSALSTALWCAFFIGLSLRLLQRSNPVVTWFVTLSYAIYILHLQPAVVFNALFLALGWSAAMAFWPTVVGAFVMSVALYYLLIKYTPLDWLLAGPRKAWFRPHWVGLASAPPPTGNPR